MPVYIGEDKIKDFYFGEEHLSKIYIGNDLVWCGIAEVIGVPPLIFNVYAESLYDYRIYGNTSQSGLSDNFAGCGEKTANLFDYSDLEGGSITESGNNWNEGSTSTTHKRTANYINATPNTTYRLSNFLDGIRIHQWSSTGYLGSGLVTADSSQTFTTNHNTVKIRLSAAAENYFPNTMLTPGTAAPAEYVPYGYEIPVTVTDGEDTVTIPVYIGDRPLMAGEYVSYAEQKIYRMAGGVLTPTDPPTAIPIITLVPGTNVFTVGTSIQPLSVYIRGKIDPVTI